MTLVGRITFFIQRKDDEKGESKDDVVTIAPEQHGLYSVTYRNNTEPHIGSRVMTLGVHETLQYVMSMMDMLPLDREPFAFLQVQLPALPSIIIEIDQLNNLHVRNQIMTAVRLTMNNWPERKVW